MNSIEQMKHFFFIPRTFFDSPEINFIRKKSVLLSGLIALQYISTPTATLVTVITLVLTDQPLTPVNVFTLLSFINLLRSSFCMEMSYGLMVSYDAYVSLKRIRDFLLLDNLDSTDTTIYQQEETEKIFLLHKSPDPQQATILGVRNVIHQKQQIVPDYESLRQDIDFTVEKGSLTVITGPVGSGKSTLLLAIAGEAPDQNWAITFRGTVVYVPQIAWVFSGTIRENILFGKKYEKSKDAKVIEVCALNQDIKKFPDCDQTIVGERGVVLSGGQRARVSLARAVYAEADLYLLDDPLTAVDFKVANHIFRECIKGLLGQKTRLITSHHERVMREADDVIVLNNGRMLGKGSFTELKGSGILNETVDSMYEEAKESDDIVVKDNEDKNGISGMGGVEAPHEAQALRVSEEDRAIGIVSASLYWNYFRSGIPLRLLSQEFACFLLLKVRPLKMTGNA